jgi:hypothetical protein
MGSLGDRADDPLMESFWGRVQTELLNRKTVAYTPGAGYRSLRVPGDLPQPSAPFEAVRPS